MTELNGKPLLYWCGCARGPAAAVIIADIEDSAVKKYRRCGPAAERVYTTPGGPFFKIGGKGRNRYVLKYKIVIRP